MKKRILVVENDKDILNIISYLLENEGYDVCSLKTVNNLMDALKSYKPDAILLDIIIPGLEDTDICRTIKSTETTKHIPLIVLSTSPFVTATIKELCADEVISKPFDLDDLVETISNQLA